LQAPLRTIATWVLACTRGGFCLADTAWAQNFQVTPISVQFQPGQMTTTLTVTNRGAETSELQIRPFLWSQAAGTDQSAATEDLFGKPADHRGRCRPGANFQAGLAMPCNDCREQLPGTDRRVTAAGGAWHGACRAPLLGPGLRRTRARAAASIEWHVAVGPQSAKLVGVNQGKRHALILKLPAGLWRIAW
jgi:hypothetical protein